jgi:hypothetical protein
MWGRIAPKAWLGLYIVAVITLLLVMCVVHAPVEYLMRRVAERSFGQALPHTWTFPYTGDICAIEPLSQGKCLILYHEPYGGFTLERYAADGSKEDSLPLESLGSEPGWLRVLPDGYLVNSSSIVVKVQEDLQVDWRMDRNTLQPPPGLPSTGPAAVGLLAAPGGLYGIDSTGALVWCAELLNPLEEMPGLGLQMRDRMMLCPTGEFLAVEQAPLQQEYRCMALSPTGEVLYRTTVPNQAYPKHVPLAGGGLALIGIENEQLEQDGAKSYWIASNGTVTARKACGVYMSHTADPQGRVFLSGIIYDDQVNGVRQSTSMLTQCDVTGQPVGGFRVPGRVCAVEFDAGGGVVVLWQELLASERGIILLSSFDRTGNQRWQQVLDRFQGRFFQLETMAGRITGDSALFAFEYRELELRHQLYCFPLPAGS